jgi:3-oxoacyl-[acyl-carrier protein] reductase
MNLELAGKVALVTGSSSGIGQGIAQSLFNEGCKVIINGRDTPRLESSAQSMGGLWVAGDMSVAGQAQSVTRAAYEMAGRLDIVVANVGSGASVAPGTEDSMEWDRMLSLNLDSAVHTVSAARHALTESKGTVLCISSICGIAALGAPVAYSAAKAAMNMYVRAMSPVLARDGIRINALAPGNIWFPGSTWDRKTQQDPAQVQSMLDSSVPMRRLGTLEEIAAVATFLCSPKASFMTGSVVVVDGGQTRI